MNDITQSGELEIVKNYIHNHDTVFDVGANVGEWSSCVLNSHKNIRLHVFEPISVLCNELRLKLPTDNIFINNLAVSYTLTTDKQFYYYKENSGLSTLYRRLIAEPLYRIKPPVEIKTTTTTIDSYCLHNNIQRINFLKIDTEGAEYDVLVGSQFMIENNLIDFIQFEYGGCYLDSKTTLEQIYLFMNLYDYKLYKITKSKIIPIDIFTKDLEDYQYSNFLLVNQPTLNHS